MKTILWNIRNYIEIDRKFYIIKGRTRTHKVELVGDTRIKVLFHKNSPHSGVVIIIHKILKHLITKMHVGSNRVIYVNLQFSQRCKIQIIHTYAQPSAVDDEDVERCTLTFQQQRKGLFLLNHGRRERENSKIHECIGLWYRRKKHARGSLLNYWNSEKIYCVNTVLTKHPNRKWTWRRSDKKTKNDILQYQTIKTSWRMYQS